MAVLFSNTVRLMTAGCRSFTFISSMAPPSAATFRENTHSSISNFDRKTSKDRLSILIAPATYIVMA